MKALLATGIREPLVYKEVDLPEHDDTFGVVRLKAAALNRRDFWITLGLYPNLRFPTVLGSDGCGVYEGEEVVISPSVSNEEAEKRFPGFRTVKPYLRMTKVD